MRRSWKAMVRPSGVMRARMIPGTPAGSIGDDVGMVQRAREARLLLQAGEEGRVAREPLAHDLERDLAL
jgi:hypothetical protein